MFGTTKKIEGFRYIGKAMGSLDSFLGVIFGLVSGAKIEVIDRSNAIMRLRESDGHALPASVDRPRGFPPPRGLVV